jgi:hypothetical protein
MNAGSEEKWFSGIIAFLPDGRPSPAVLTTEETIELLRLDAVTGARTLKYYRDEGLLTGIKLGRKIRYPLPSVLEFLRKKTDGRLR